MRVERAVASRLDVRHEHVLDVDHADDLIEALAIDRQPAVSRVRECTHEIFEADVTRHGDNVASGHADFAGRLLAEMEQVAQHLALDRAEVAGDGLAVGLFGLIDRFLDFRAEGRLRFVAEDQVLDAPPQPRAACRRRASPSAGPFIGVCDPEPGERTDLARLHVGGFAIVMVIVAEKVKVPWTSRCAAWVSTLTPFCAASASQTP